MQHANVAAPLLNQPEQTSPSGQAVHQVEVVDQSCYRCDNCLNKCRMIRMNCFMKMDGNREKCVIYNDYYYDIPPNCKTSSFIWNQLPVECRPNSDTFV